MSLGSVLILLSAIPAVLSVIVYARLPWWKSGMGRHLMSYMGVVAVVLTLSAASRTLGDSEWFRMLRLAVFVGVPVVMWWRLAILVRSWRDARAGERYENEKRG